MYRLKQALLAESHFFDRLLERPEKIKPNAIKSTNLSYLVAVHDALSQLDNLDEVMRPVGLPPKDGQWMAQETMLRSHSVKVDLVTQDERVWIKVIARNTKAFRHEMAGLEWGGDSDSDDNEEAPSSLLLRSSSNSDTSNDSDDDVGDDSGKRRLTQPSGFKDLPIFKKAGQFLKAAQAHRQQFKAPVVVFAFMRIDMQANDPFMQWILDHLQDMGIGVYLLDQPGGLRGCYQPLVERVFGPDLENITTASINLDVSTVLAMVSELAHHVCAPEDVEGEPLQKQAVIEAADPILPRLRRLLQGKRLFMVQSAMDRLRDIMSVVAGPRERLRYQQLFPDRSDLFLEAPVARSPLSLDDLTIDDDPDRLWTSLGRPPAIEILPDHPSDRFLRLLKGGGVSHLINNGRKIRTRFTDFHATIFGTADRHQMSSLTGIQWVNHALTKAGITDTSILIHEPRSLAEQKMHTNSA
ncbi:hypothetical protein DM01DRAFT_300930 [Hesseltinella vesiculosa]|uniref:DUF1308 domain-containing protein n=1 Tax=Hesseltinella vesiculosa TaxID=101127 RepID=A0A1X2GAB3_9FUNG|nr:hypothetical protein DM01DRAFT_300930 [Hesseltinella vesiculosa]